MATRDTTKAKQSYEATRVTSPPLRALTADEGHAGT